MARLVRTFTVGRRAVDVFDAIADLATAREWDPGVRSSRPGDGPRVGEGASWHVHTALGPLELPLVYTTTTWDRPEHVVHEARHWYAIASDDVRITEVRGATTVTWEAAFTFRGPGRLLDGLVRGGFERAVDRALQGLENWLLAGGRGHDAA